MAQRGQTRNVLLPPIVHTEIDPAEEYAPIATELRNGKLTDAGTWVRRPGLASWFTPIGPGNFVQVATLVPAGPGYYTLANGRVFSLTPIPTRILGAGGALHGDSVPTWTRYRNFVLFADGGSPMSLNLDTELLALLGGNPPSGRFIDTLDTYVLLAGFDDLGFRWSDVNTMDQWPAENSNSLSDEGEKIRMMKVLRRELWFFKDRSIELWRNMGGANPFQRQLKIARGTPAGRSVVQANDTFYFLGDDRDFYVLDGQNPRVIPKSQARQMRGVLSSLANPSEVYGFDFRREGIVRWFAPTQGLVLAYDYVRDLFSFDSMWRSGVHAMLPINAYAEVDGVAYAGAFEPTGEIRQWRDDATTDLGEPIRMVRRFRVALTADGTLANVNRLRLRMKRGYDVNPFVPNPQLLVRWALDGEWQPFATFPIGPAGDVDPYVDAYRLGQAREIEIEMVESETVPYHVTHCYLTIEPLGR